VTVARQNRPEAISVSHRKGRILAARATFLPEPCPGCGGKVRRKDPSARGRQRTYCDDSRCRKRQNQRAARGRARRNRDVAGAAGPLARLPVRYQEQLVDGLEALEIELEDLLGLTADMRGPDALSKLAAVRLRMDELRDRVKTLREVAEDFDSP
jgi:hypothetical protein